MEQGHSGADESGGLYVTSLCAMCGRPLYTYQIAARINGEFTDFIERESGTVTFYLCDECFEMMLEYVGGGVEAAIKRQKEDIQYGDHGADHC